MSNKVARYFLISIILYNLLLRSISFEQHGGDSWSHSLRTITLLDYGRVSWYLDPLSLFGLYPFSYASGISLFSGSLVLTTSIHITKLLVIISIFLSILANLSLFILCRNLNFSNEVSLLSMFFLSSTLAYLSFTYSVLSTRGALISLTPIVSFVLLKTYNKNIDYRFLLLSLTGITSIASIHLMFGHFLVLICIPLILHKFSNYFYPNFEYRLSNRSNSLILFIIFIISIVQFLGVIWIKKGVRYYYPVLPDSNVVYSIINIISSYLHAYGPHSTFFIFGFLFILFTVKDSKKRFILYPTVLSSFFIFDTGYFLAFNTFIFSIFTAYGFLQILKSDSLGYRLPILFSLVTYIPVIAYYFSSTYLIIFLITLTCSLLVLVNLYIKDNKAAVAICMFIILTASYPINQVTVKDFRENEAYPNSGDYLVGSQHENRGFWVSHSSTQKVFANSPVIANPICVYSGNLRAVTYYDIGENSQYYNLISTEFNFTHMFNYYDVSFVETDVNDRHNINLVIQLISRGEFDLAKKFEVSLVVIRDEGYLSDNPAHLPEDLETEFNIFVIENRYSVYTDSGSHIYHYETYKK